jgi:AmmeMemoRadiSam system protein A
VDVPLSPDERETLLRLARHAIEAAVHGRRVPAADHVPASGRLSRLGASFVTLSKHGALRGCIGGLQATVNLSEDVAQHAAAAALDDYRFPPVQPAELDDIHIEISVLTEPAPLPYANADDLIAKLRPHIDGVILISGQHKATFLPQVWEKVSGPEVFLDMLCDKAGLPRQTWRRGDVEIRIYQVESFGEPEPSD